MSDTAVLDTPQTATPVAPTRSDPAAGELRGMDVGEFRARLDTAFSKLPDAKRVKAKAAKTAPAATTSPEPTSSAPTADSPVSATPEPVQQATQETQVAAEVDDDIKSQKTWERYKNGFKLSQAQAKQIEDYQKQIEGFSTERQEFEKLKKELDDQRQLVEKTRSELYQYDVTKTPEWTETVSTPFDKVIKAAGETASLNRIDPNKFMDAVELLATGDRGGLNALLEGMDEKDAIEVRTDARDLAKNILTIKERAQELRANSKQALETSNRKREEQMRQQQEAYWKTFDGALSNVGEKFESTVKQFLPEDHSLNFTDIRSRAREIDSWSPEERALAGYTAWAMPELVGALETWQKRALAAEEQNSKLRNGAPKTTVGTPATTSTADTSKTDYKGKTGKQFASESAARIRLALGLPVR